MSTMPVRTPKSPYDIAIFVAEVHDCDLSEYLERGEALAKRAWDFGFMDEVLSSFREVKLSYEVGYETSQVLYKLVARATAYAHVCHDHRRLRGHSGCTSADSTTSTPCKARSRTSRRSNRFLQIRSSVSHGAYMLASTGITSTTSPTKPSLRGFVTSWSVRLLF